MPKRTNAPVEVMGAAASLARSQESLESAVQLVLSSEDDLLISTLGMCVTAEPEKPKVAKDGPGPRGLFWRPK